MLAETGAYSWFIDVRAELDGLNSFRDELVAIFRRYTKCCDDALLQLAPIGAAEGGDGLEISKWFFEHGKIR